MMSAVIFYSALFLALLFLPMLVIFVVLSFFDHEQRLWGEVRTWAAPFAERVVKLPLVGFVRTRFPRTLSFFSRRFDPRVPWGLAATISFAVLLLGGWFLGDILRQIGGKNPLVTLDLRLHNSLPLFRSATLTAVMLGITELGGPLFLWPLSVGLALLAFAREKRRLAATFLLAVASFSILSVVIKLLAGHARPLDSLIHARANSFPSGHMLGSAVVYGLLASAVMGSRLSRGVRAFLSALLILLIVGIGLSRLYLGVHWPSDLLGSLALALSCLSGLLFFLHFPAPIKRFDALSMTAFPRLAGGLGWLSIGVAFATAIFLFGRTKMIPAGPPAIAQALELGDLLEQLPEHMPSRSEDLVGGEMEPVSLVFVGTRDELRETFQHAGWTLADLPTPVRVVKEAIAAVTNGLDPSAPATPAYYADRPQTLTFEKSDAEAPGIRRRHHTRIWQTSYCVAPECRILWVATASFDDGIEISRRLHLPTHHIDSKIDLERDLIVSDLVGAGVRKLGSLRIVDPLEGTNAAGDRFTTDGHAALLSFPAASRPQASASVR